MFKYSKKSLNILNKVDNRLRIIFYELIKITKIDVGITYGIRTLEEQQAIFNNGKSQCDGVKNVSKHQIGQAVDFVCYKDNKYTTDIKYYYYVVGLIEKIALDLDIKIQSGIWWTFEDGGHVELVEGDRK